MKTSIFSARQHIAYAYLARYYLLSPVRPFVTRVDQSKAVDDRGMKYHCADKRWTADENAVKLNLVSHAITMLQMHWRVHAVKTYCFWTRQKLPYL